MSATARTSRPSRRTARIAGVGVVAAGLVASAALVWQASYSAFSATTANPTNTWSTGTVALGDDDLGQALFTSTSANLLKPGAGGSRCITVTSTGSLGSTMRLYATAGSFTQTNTVGDNLQLTVTQGSVPTGTTAGGCAGFTSDSGAGSTTSMSATAFAATYTDYAHGFGSWTPAAASSASPVTRTYRFDYVLGVPTAPANSPPAQVQALTDAMQNGTAALGFTWEAQNT